jgi:cell division protein FtsW
MKLLPGRGSKPEGKSAKGAASKATSQSAGDKATGTRSHAGPTLGSSGYLNLLAVVSVLCAFGLMMVLSASSVEALRSYGNSWVFFQRQVAWMVIGIVLMVIALRTDYRIWRRWKVPALAASAGLLLLVLVPGIGLEVGGAQRWLGFGPLRMQPSELAKFAMLLFTADLLARRVDKMHVTQLTLRPVLVVFAGFAGLIMLQPNMGTTLILGAITVSVLFVAGTPIKPMLKIGAIGGAVAVFAAFAEPYRRARLMSFMNPFAEESAGGYQVVQSLVGIGSGGITGVGLGASRAKWGFLPDAHTDFIFAIVAEELGLIGAFVVIALFVGFALLGVRAATRAPDRFGQLLAAGITVWVTVQALLNLGAVIGLLPVTGVPLPFLSQGGSSLVILMAATGILLNIARQGEMPSKVPTQ